MQLNIEANKFSKQSTEKGFLIGVQGVDEQVHQLLNVFLSLPVVLMIQNIRFPMTSPRPTERESREVQRREHRKNSKSVRGEGLPCNQSSSSPSTSQRATQRESQNSQSVCSLNLSSDIPPKTRMCPLSRAKDHTAASSLLKPTPWRPLTTA